MAKISKRRFLAAYFETFRPSKWLFAAVFIILAFLAYWSSSYIAVGEPRQVTGVLRAVEPPHGGDSLFSGFEFELAGAQHVTLYLPKNTPARIGQNVIIKVQPTLLGGETYRFVGYQD